MKFTTVFILTLAIALVLVSARCISTQNFINQQPKESSETQSSYSSH